MNTNLTNYLITLLSLTSSKQQEKFARIYPEGALLLTKDKLPLAILQVERTIKDCCNNYEQIIKELQEYREQNKHLKGQISSLQNTLKHTMDDLSRVQDIIKSHSNPINVDDVSVQQQLLELDKQVQAITVDRLDGYEYIK